MKILLSIICFFIMTAEAHAEISAKEAKKFYKAFLNSADDLSNRPADFYTDEAISEYCVSDDSIALATEHLGHKLPPREENGYTLHCYRRNAVEAWKSLWKDDKDNDFAISKDVVEKTKARDKYLIANFKLRNNTITIPSTTQLHQSQSSIDLSCVYSESIELEKPREGDLKITRHIAYVTKCVEKNTGSADNKQADLSPASRAKSP